MYELSEDQFITMQFLSGKGKTAKEFSEFRPANKIWNDHDSTRVFIELTVADFVDLSDQTIMRLNKKGEEYLKEYLKMKLREEEEKNLQFAKLKLDVSNAERVYKTYWLTFTFALVGFIISLVLLIIKLKTGR